MKYLVTFVFSVAVLGLSSGDDSASAQTEGVNANAGIAFLLRTVRSVVFATFQRPILMPDIYEEVDGAAFNFTRGYLRELSTIARDGPANVTSDGSSFIVDVPLKLTTLNVGYNLFNATTETVYVVGASRIHVANDAFSARLRLTPGSKCVLDVEKVSVAALSGIEIDFLYMGDKSVWFENNLSDAAETVIKGALESKVQEALDSGLRKTIRGKESRICAKFFA